MYLSKVILSLYLIRQNFWC